MKSAFKYIAVALMAFLPLSQLDAKGSSGGGRSSFSSSPRTSTPSVSKPSGFSSSSSTKPSAVKPTTSVAPKTAFDKSQAARSIRPPTPPKPKSEYINEFRTQNASKYPTKFATPPATRPNYIPESTVVGGQQRPIIYNQSAGGYGFMDGLGQFMIYDAITDMASNAFQKDQVVYVQQAKEHENAVKQQQILEQKEEGMSAFQIFLLIVVLGIAGIVLWVFFFNNSY